LSGDAYASVNGQTYTFNIAGNILPAHSQNIQFYISGTSGGGTFDIIANAYVAQASVCNNDTCVFAQSSIEASDTAQLHVVPLTATVNTTDATCGGLCNGSAAVTCTGIAPFGFAWSTGGATTQTDSGLCAGNYSVTVIDAKGCRDTVLFTISEPAPFIATINSVPGIPCSNACTGSASVQLTGGTAPYTYAWSTGATINNISNLCSDSSYSVIVADINGCTTTDNVTMINNYPPVPTASISTLNTDTNCIKVGNAVLFYTPFQSGATYLWNFGDEITSTIQNPSHTFTDFGFFQISLTVTNACDTVSGCKSIFINPATYNCNTVFDIADSTQISGNAAWNNTNYPSGVKVKGDVYIPANQSLAITNVTVLFAPRGRLVVGKGGRLVIKNATLDALGNYMWQGIEVWGQTNLPSTDTLNQGRVYITNNSSITNAYIGVLLGKRLLYGECHWFTTAMGGWDTQKSGGVIRTQNSNFTGNAVDIRFISKSNNDGQTNMIDACKFTCPANLKDAHYSTSATNYYPSIRNSWAGYANANQRTDIGIVSVGLSKLKFTNSTFRNLEYGITTFDNQQTVVSNCKFSYHRQGIRVYNTVTTIQSSYDISGCNFDSIPGNTQNLISYNDDGTAIYTSGSYGDSIHDGNIFNNTYSPTIPAYGIKTDNASGFEITNNRFYSLTTGITIQNSFTSGGNVRAKASSGIYSWQGNIFTTCKTGIATWNDNSALCLRCNDHIPSSSSLDINWVNEPASSLADQGFDPGALINTNAAVQYGSGNLYQTSLNKKIASSTPYKYYHHIDANTIPVPTGPITLLSVGWANSGGKSVTCPFPTPPPSTILPGSLNTPVFLRIDSLNNVVLNLESQYSTLVNNADKGHTQQLLNAINATPPSGQLKNTLLADSPLSDTVLIALNTQNPLSNGNYKNVMNENLPVTRNVVPSFNSRLETLPPGIKNQLKAEQASNPGKITTGYLETMLNQAKLTKQLYFNEIISLLLENNRKADAITLFEREGTPVANMLLAATYLSDSNYSSAAAKIALLPNDNSQYAQWKAYSTFLLNFYAQGKTLEQLDSSQVEYVRTVAYQCPEGMATVNAKAILMYLFRENVPPCLVNGTCSMKLENNPAEKTTSSYLGDNYPDPFSRNTIIPYYLPEGCKGELSIKDVTGRLILIVPLQEGENKLEIDSKDWANGVYFYGMWLNGENVDNKKMIKSE
jgi:PKD repeat protein